MSKICGIYSIFNKLNRKTYIGSSCDIKRRWRHHRQNLNKGVHHCIHLQRAWNKYGENNFVFTVEQICKSNELINIEQSYLDKAKADSKKYYNSTYHAGGQEPKTVTKKQKEDIKKYWLKNNTAETFIYAKKKYGFGMLLIQYLLVDIRKETKKRPEHTHLINSKIYTFYHTSGDIFIGRQFDLRKKYNVPHGNLSCMVSGKIHSCCGWSINPPNNMTNIDNSLDSAKYSNTKTS